MREEDGFKELHGAATPAYRWIILIVATLVHTGVALLQQIPAALGPLVAMDLNLSRMQIGLLTSAIVGGMTLTTLLMGMLIDRYGERRVVFAGVSTMTVLVFAATWGETFGWLFVLFLLASFGASSSTPGGSKAVAAWFSHHQRGMALGVRQTGIPLGGLVAAVLLPPLAVAFGWRTSLTIGATLTLLIVVLFALLYREVPERKKTVDKRRVSLETIVRNRSFLAVTGYSLVLVGAQWAATAYLVLYLNEAVGLPVVAAGIFLAVLQVGGIAGRIGWGIISDSAGKRKPALVVVALIAAAAALAMALTDNATSPLIIAPLTALLGFSLLGWNGLYITVIAESVPVRAAATALGAGLTITNVGSLLVPPVFGLLIDATGSYTIFWLALVTWVAGGAVLGTMVREPRVGR